MAGENPKRLRAQPGLTRRPKAARFTRQTWTVIASGGLFVILAALLALIPVPYSVWSPGEALDVLGDYNGEPVLSIKGTGVYQVDGELYMPRVTMTAADASIGLTEAVWAFFRGDQDLFPYEVSYPVGVPAEAWSDDENLSAAQRNVAVAAIREAFKDPEGNESDKVTQAPMVTSVAVGSPAYDADMRVNDIINAVDSKPVQTRAQVEAAVRAKSPGEVIQFDVTRVGDDAEEVDRTLLVKAQVSNSTDSTTVIGATFGNTYKYAPIQLAFHIDARSQGKGNGLIMALGVYDMLAEENLLAGRVVAGTGDIDTDGVVSSAAVAGLREKVYSAEAAGATIFLVPDASCSDIQGIGTPMQLVRVVALADAIDSLRKLAADPLDASVPRC